MSEYKEFIFSKKHKPNDYGIDSAFIPNGMFDFQEYTTRYLVKKGRCAAFLDTGLGKTIIELSVANSYLKEKNKKVLIITPLAVAFQFIKEAEKFGIDDIEYSKDGKHTKGIVLCNYERLHLFNSTDFECVILDESSILKNFEGAIKTQVTAFLRNIPYRFLFTATPSPNDFIELGTSSEALGYMGYTDMLTRFFKNNEDTVSPMNIGTQWLLKGHAQDDFFDWVSSWSLSMRKPSDHGFSDERHILPELIVNDVEVAYNSTVSESGQMMLYKKIAKTQSEVRSENKNSIISRCEKAAELASAHGTTVYWVNLNKEADLLQKMDHDSHQIKGSMPLEKKEELLLAFANGDIKKLITKPKITAFGLNWQHCGHTVFFPTFSYEQWYQSIRRFWRFGRTGTVYADRVYSDGMARVLLSLDAKTRKANELFSKLNSAISKNVNSQKQFVNDIKIPSWIK